MALTWMFPLREDADAVTPSTWFYANNAAFERDTFLSRQLPPTPGLVHHPANLLVDRLEALFGRDRIPRDLLVRFVFDPVVSTRNEESVRTVTVRRYSATEYTLADVGTLYSSPSTARDRTYQALENASST
jgi:hypothetical protein